MDRVKKDVAFKEIMEISGVPFFRCKEVLLQPEDEPELGLQGVQEAR